MYLDGERIEQLQSSIRRSSPDRSSPTMRAQGNEVSSSTTFHPVPESVVSSLNCFDERGSFSDLLSSPFECESCIGFDVNQATDTPTEATSQSNRHSDAIDANVEFESLLEEVDECVRRFDLDLDDFDLARCSFAATHEPNSELVNLGREATATDVQPLVGDALPTREHFEKKKTPKTSSQRQREEIASLRGIAARLEQDLRRIKFVSQQRPPSVKEESESEDSSLMLSSLWMAVAKRQEAEKQRAEQENAYLKKQLKASVVLAKSLERSLRRRTRVLTAEC